MVLKKNKANSKILFIEASKECKKVTNNNQLEDKNIDTIVDEFASRTEIEHFAHLASYEEIVDNDYNLSVSSYVEAEDTREEVDIAELNAKIADIVEKENALRAELDRIIAEMEG